jgi:hypothetical protein
MLDVAVRYLMDEDGHGRRFAEVMGLYQDLVASFDFASSFERHMGISVEEYGENSPTWFRPIWLGRRSRRNRMELWQPGPQRILIGSRCTGVSWHPAPRKGRRPQSGRRRPSIAQQAEVHRNPLSSLRELPPRADHTPRTTADLTREGATNASPLH